MIRKEIEFMDDEDKICLYCGEPMQEQIGDGYESSWKCDCKDAVRNREIDRQIDELEASRPKYKFLVSKRVYVVKVPVRVEIGQPKLPRFKQ